MALVTLYVLYFTKTWQIVYFMSLFQYCLCVQESTLASLNSIAFRKAKIVYSFCLSECNRVK